MITVIRVIGFTILLSAFSFRAAAEDFTNAIAAYLQHYVHAQLPHGCMVVGIVDEHGSSVVSCGDLDNGTGRQADGDTLFNLESATGAFFALLLQDMVDRGKIKPDVPMAKYLPASVTMPTYKGNEITVRQLAKETSGLHPLFADFIDPKRADAPFAGLTDEHFFAVISKCQLTAAPGKTHQHPSVDAAVLHEAMALTAGTDIESLLKTRILEPLQMNDTAITLTPGQESRLAPEHSSSGISIPRWDGEDFKPWAALYSTANDLLKFLSACRTSPHLLALWDNTASNFAFNPQVVGLRHTGGGWSANGCYIAFDEVRRRGVVILANAYEPRANLGDLLFDSEWQSDRRPQPVKVTPEVCASCIGQYRRAPDYELGRFVLRYYVFDRPRAATLVPAALGLVVLAVLFWRAPKRWFILGWVVLAGAVLAALLPALASHVYCARLHPGIGIRSEGERLFAEDTNSTLCPIEFWPTARAWTRKVYPIDVTFPPVTVPVELLPESETRFFERLSGVPLTFSRDASGKVTGLTLHYHGKDFRYDRISDTPPKATEPVIPPVIVKLDTNRLDACVGRYEVAAGTVFPAGMKLTVWREGDQLLARAQGAGQNFLLGAFPMFAQSETNFFDKITGGQFRFMKNDQGQVIALTHHPTGTTMMWFPEWEAKKLKE